MRSLFLLLGAAVAVDAAVAGSDLFAENIEKVLLTGNKGFCADGCVLDDVFYSKTGGACLPEEAIVLTDDQYGNAEPGTLSGVAFDCKGWHPDERWRKPRPDEWPTRCEVRSYADPEDIECPFRGLINSETVWRGEIERKRQQFVLGRHRTTQQSEPTRKGRAF
ncbi:hypothetical protein V2A60_004099 [Cordyceps javanica]